MSGSTRYHIRVCGGPRCAERGSERLRVALYQALAARGLSEKATVSRLAGVCHGKCRLGPNVFVSPGETWYCGVTADDIPAIIDEHVGAGRPVQRLVGQEPSFLRLDETVPW
ncbi:MAG: (2Fe-2S) ferredoxin domain-containing protein [Chloroflexota bacterium]|nr:(2Fe-2S) ferredoxin domain-containing protein [Dehalococcoidia bacterium]MDW8254804.1 (2Fe-2S) ferredoxin domain-containing protein [Chloroflexota bacterium]